jgi:[CysO sulfur-carrier protein]-S-L-cysteine hydrolase
VTSYPIAGRLLMHHELHAELVGLCRAGMPNEACGIAAGQADIVMKLHPLTNVSASPERYTVDPYEQLDAYRAIADAGLEPIAVYHSHPHTPARPSETDIAEAYDPDAAYVIVSLAEPTAVVRAFSIRDGDVTELIIQTPGAVDDDTAAERTA